MGPNFEKAKFGKLSDTHPKDLIDCPVDLPRMSREYEAHKMQCLALS
jgi:hypothetical protein